jgi:hypothetical protein
LAKTMISVRCKRILGPSEKILCAATQYASIPLYP